MLKTLFLVLHPTEPKILNYCHNLSELFRLREHFKTHDARVFRYMPANKKFDLYAVWNGDELKWELNSCGIGFEQVSYKSLEKAWEFICRLS